MYLSIKNLVSLKFMSLATNLFQVTLIHLEDQPRSGVSGVIAELKSWARLRVMMLTGDHDSSAWRVANAVGITEVYCNLKPEDKLNHVKNIAREGGDHYSRHSH